MSRLCTYWRWWDEWDDTALQTQDSKFKPLRSEAEHAISRSRRLPTILSFTSGLGRNIFNFFKPPRPGNEPRTLAWKAAVLTTTQKGWYKEGKTVPDTPLIARESLLNSKIVPGECPGTLVKGNVPPANPPPPNPSIKNYIPHCGYDLFIIPRTFYRYIKSYKFYNF